MLVLGLPLLVNRVAGVTICPSAGLLGIPCPGCGLSRATLAALHGHFAEAFALHPLFIILTPIYGGMMLHVVVTALFDWSPPPLPPKAAWWVSLATGILAALAFSLWLARLFGWFGGPVAVERWFHG